MKNKSSRSGDLLVILGLLLMLSAAVIFTSNTFDSRSACELAGERLPAVKQLIEERSDAPDESGSDETEPQPVPVAEIDGESYDGCIAIPSLDLELPVMDTWSMELLNIAPCRYYGSARTNDLVIAAHNFQSSFGRLRDINPGDEVYFTDMDGTVYRYIVRDIEVVEPDAVDYMVSSGWDLSLYTCTYSGKQRLTVRCELDAPEAE